MFDLHRCCLGSRKCCQLGSCCSGLQESQVSSHSKTSAIEFQLTAQQAQVIERAASTEDIAKQIAVAAVGGAARDLRAGSASSALGGSGGGGVVWDGNGVGNGGHGEDGGDELHFEFGWLGW